MKIQRFALLNMAAWSVVCLLAANNVAAPRGASDGVTVLLKAFKVASDGDKEALVAADKIKPGEIIEYQVKYSNEGNRAVRGLAATLPIPAALEVLPGTARPANVTASLDGRSFSAVPLTRVVKSPGDQEKTVAVPYSEYRFLRWTIGTLEAGKSVNVSARARLAKP